MVKFNNTETAFRYKSKADLRRGFYLFKLISNPAFVKAGQKLTDLALALHIPIGWALKPTLYRHFVGGETIAECSATVRLMAKYSVRSILDYSVEGGKDPETMQRTLEETLQSVVNAGNDPFIPFSVFKPTAFATAEVLTQASGTQTLTLHAKEGLERFRANVEMLCKTAFDNNTPIMIDAEDSWYQPIVDQVVTEMMEKFNKQKAIVYNTLQMYRTDRMGFLKESLDKATAGNYFLGIKFVRGAYMEKERKRADEKGYPSPIQPDKPSTDAAYDAALTFSVEHLDRISIFNGSHNEKSNQHLAQLMEIHGIAKNDNRIWFSQLYGMSDHISFNLAAEGYNVAKYVPYGPVRNILPYLMRRAEENTSIAGQTGRELSLIKAELWRRKGKV
jgi:proline dehydrogenase